VNYTNKTNRKTGAPRFCGSHP